MSEPVRVERHDKVELVILQHGANALDDELIAALEAVLERPAPARPLVIASAHPSIFCPGWDLRRLDGLKRERLRAFIERYNTLVRRLATYPAPVVAAISGHAIAGGCLLALACDRRVMARARARLGLSEINLGIPVPAGSVAMLLALYQTRAVEQLVLEGDGFGGERALELGLVERLADGPAVVGEALRLAGHLATRPPGAYAAAKRFLRHDLGRIMSDRDGAELEPFLDLWFEPDTQDRIGATIAAMSRR